MHENARRQNKINDSSLVSSILDQNGSILILSALLQEIPPVRSQLLRASPSEDPVPHEEYGDVGMLAGELHVHRLALFFVPPRSMYATW